MKKNELQQAEPQGQLFVTPLEEVLPQSMLPYAEFVILDRALPRVEDGLKPVQRRILYTMFEMGLMPDKPHKKSARIVGDCMGKYHPHGDSSVYDAMVRMAQDFNMGMTLVNGHGNFGSVDGDPAAAMRYTEARLEPLALELLRDLDKNTVPFSLNFDDSLKEPDMLPGRFPNLLVNGASGIAVGLATNIPPHNLGEVIGGVIAYIDNPRITLEKMMKYIPAPDFPTGGKIIAKELEQAYATGKGKITLRAKVSVELAEGERPTGEDDAAVKRNIVITELPYQVNKAALLRKIAELREQKSELAPITKVVDESDRSGMRAVVEVKGTGKDAEKVLAALYKYTDLEVSFGINMVAIAKGKPLLMGLMDIIRYYVEYQREVVLRRTKFDLNQAKERCHILEGLIVAVQNIDEVIKIIKGADSTADARDKLRKRFELSEKQAQAILDLRLARLTKLEVFKLEEEHRQLQKLIAELTEIVGSQRLQLEVVKKEISELAKKYAVPRRTSLPESEEEAFAERFDVYVPGEPSQLLLTADGKIKCVEEKKLKTASQEVTPSTRRGNIIADRTAILSNADALIITDRANCYRVNMRECMRKWSDAGLKLTDVTDAAKDEKIVALFSEEETATLLFVTRMGEIMGRDLADIAAGKGPVVKMEEGDRLVAAERVIPDGRTLYFVTRNGMCLNMKMDDFPVRKTAATCVKGMGLKTGDAVIWAKLIDDCGELVLATTGGRFKRIIVSQIDPIGRGSQGVRVADMKEDKILFADYVTKPYELAVFTEEGTVEKITTEDVPIDATYTRGRPLKGVKWMAKEIVSVKY